MRLIIDANLSPSWIDWLAAKGFEAVHWSVVGDGDAPDSEIMDYAAENGFVVVTRDLDFGKMLLHRSATLPSVIQLRKGHAAPSSIGETLVEHLRSNQSKLTSGAILTVTLERSRLTLLPLRIKP